MSAIPIRQEAPKTLFLELCNADLTLDTYQDRLTSQGYEVISTKGYDEAIQLARMYLPALVIVYDDPTTSIDAVKWIELQHSDRAAQLAMIPILILADANRMNDLREQELPDRV